MKIILKDKLKELRKQKDITQEQLANHLGISQQSVGKWERGEGYPDITMLPAITLYFGITLDELLGINEARINEAVETYQAESRVLLNNGEVKKDMELWEKAFKKFPNNDTVKSSLLHSLYMYWFNNSDKCPDIASRIIKLGEDILNTSTDNYHREGAIQTLCYTYNLLGDNENAKKYACMGGSFYVTRFSLLASILTGEEAVKQCQINIRTLTELINIAARKACFEGNYTSEEKIRIHNFCINLYKLVFEDGDYGFYACRLTQSYHDIAFEYATLGNAEACLDALESVVKYAVIYDTQPNFKHTSLLQNAMEHDNSTSHKNYTENECAIRLKGIQHEAYYFVRDNPRFIKISEELKKYAN